LYVELQARLYIAYLHRRFQSSLLNTRKDRPLGVTDAPQVHPLEFAVDERTHPILHRE